MFDFIWRWLGGGSSSKPKKRAGRQRDDEEEEPLDPEQKRAWIAAQRKRIADHFAAEAELDDPDPQAAWSFPPHVIIWSIRDGWAISGAPPIEHVVGDESLGSARDAARHFARRFRERSRRLASSKGRADESDALARWAEALMNSVRLDDGWSDALPGDEPPSAQRAEELLRGALFDTSADPDLTPTLRILHRRKEAPGGDHHGIYFYLDVSGRPGPRLFDALARRMVEIDTQFAPLVAYRVQYALVYFGVNFGQPAKEMEVEKQADEMRARNPELSRRIDEYGPKGNDMLPIHFVDSTDQPFTAHPCMVREPGKPYTAEAKYFNCRDRAFHKQMEGSSDVGLRLIAASIDPDVVAEARRAFRARRT